MGKKTSVYLPDDLAAAVEASGTPMAELLRRGLREPPLELADVATMAAEKALAETAGSIGEDVRQAVREGVREALRDLQGGGF